MKIPPIVLRAFELSLLGVAICSGQTPGTTSWIPAGFHLYDISVASSYYTSTYGVEPGSPVGAVGGSSADVVQASGTLGWSRSGPNSNLSINYSPSFMRGLQQSRYQSFNQSANVIGSAKLNAHWTAEYSFQGSIADYSQLLFASTLYGNLTAAPVSSDTLASSIGSTPALLQIAGPTPGISAPETSFLYGTHQLNAAATVSFLYSVSSRSSYTFTLLGNRSQYLNSQTGTLGTGYVLPETTSAGVDAGWSYSLDPRTSFTVQETSARTVSRFEDVYNTQGSISLSRLLTQHWFAQAMLGVGTILPASRATGVTSGAQQEYGGSVGYKFGSQSLLGSFNRSVSDVYGLGAYATESSSAAWTYRRPGASVSLSGAFGYTRLLGPAFPNWGSWTAHMSATKNLDSHTAVSLSYSYMQYPQTVLLHAPDLSQNGVQVAVSWSPTVRR